MNDLEVNEILKTIKNPGFKTFFQKTRAKEAMIKDYDERKKNTILSSLSQDFLLLAADQIFQENESLANFKKHLEDKALHYQQMIHRILNTKKGILKFIDSLPDEEIKNLYGKIILKEAMLDISVKESLKKLYETLARDFTHLKSYDAIKKNKICYDYFEIRAQQYHNLLSGLIKNELDPTFKTGDIFDRQDLM